MKILTIENESYELDHVPDQIDDFRYCVLDYTNPAQADYIFVPLVFLESFNSPAITLNIGGRSLMMPMDWSVIIADANMGDPEIMPITSINDRGFTAFTLNPIAGYMAEYHPIELTNVFQNMKWYFPKLKFGHILAVPIEDKPQPLCAYFVKDANKVPEVLDINKLI
tara:strand:- start:366 stop:866 length:501 start_codon:yes stop_codon:yes gene_type:complete